MNHKFYNYHIFGEETTRLSDCTLLLYLHVCFNFIYGMVGASDPEKFLVSNPMHLAKAAVPRPLVIQVRCDLKYEIWNITRCRNDLTMLFPAKSMAIHAYPWLSAKSLLFVFQTAANWQNAELIRKNTGFVPHFSGPALAPHGAPRLTTRRVGRCYNAIIKNALTAWQWDSFKFQSRICCKLHPWVVSQRLRLFNSNDSDW